MTAMCAGRVDDVGNPLEKPSPTTERKISQDVSVQKSISIPLSANQTFIAHHGWY